MPRTKSNTTKPATTKPRAKSSMSDEHKAALAQGRLEGRVVRDYLAALRASKPKRGRKRTTASINSRLATIDSQLPTASPIDELRLVQEKHNLITELETVDADVDRSGLEDAFVEIAASYGDRHGISYSSWREVGVPAAVLKRAGVGRSS
jgi:hypothetical protein